MATTCWSSIRGKAMRATKIDECGAVVAGPKGTLTTKGFVQVSYSFEVDEGTEISVPDANGDLCISEPGTPTIKWVNVVAQFCRVDPDLINMFTGFPVVADAAGGGVGFRVRDTIQANAGVGLEVWSDITGTGGVCAGGDRLYGYFLVPWINKGVISGDIVVQNGEATFELTGKGVKGSQWDTGPYLVDAVDTPAPGTPAKLATAIGANDLMDIHATTIAPPTPACGATTLTPAA
jgi:hypothetical protein